MNKRVEGSAVVNGNTAGAAGIVFHFGTIAIADLVYTVGRTPSNDKYVVEAVDTGEGTSAKAEFDGEDDAIKAFAALIACDEPDLTARLAAIADKFAGYIG